VSATVTVPVAGPAVAALGDCEGVGVSGVALAEACPSARWSRQGRRVRGCPARRGGAGLAGERPARSWVTALTDAAPLASAPPLTLTVSFPVAAAFPSTLATTVIGGSSPSRPAARHPR